MYRQLYKRYAYFSYQLQRHCVCTSSSSSMHNSRGCCGVWDSDCKNGYEFLQKIINHETTTCLHNHALISILND